MERPEAIDLNEPTYTTGRPCKHGHYAYRYTQSGTCSECINPKTEEKFDLIEMKVRVFDVNLTELTTIVHFAAMLRYQNISVSEVTCKGRRTGIVQNTSVRYFKVHKDDYDSLLKLSISMFTKQSSSQFDMSEIIERNKKAAVSNPLPEWKP